MNSYRMTVPDRVAVLVDMIEAANYDSGRNKILEGLRNMKVVPKGGNTVALQDSASC